MINIPNKTKEIIISDFSKMELFNKTPKTQVDCAQIYNFNTANSTLEKGMGLRSLVVYKENKIDSKTYELDYHSLGLKYFNKVMYFKQYFTTTKQTMHRLLFHGSDNKLYVFQMFSNLNMLNWTYEMTFYNSPVVLEYKKDGIDSALISANDKLVVWTTGQVPYEVTGLPVITSMCVYNDILYCTIADDSDKIWYTSSLNPESFGIESDDTKYLILEDYSGGAKKLLTFKENIYIFRDYGISRLKTSSKGAPTYNHIYESDSKIYPNSVSICGDFVIFVTNDGVYKFNGATVTKIEGISKLIKNGIKDYAVATNLRDDYYLAVRLNFADDKVIGCESEEDMKNNAIIKLNLSDYSFEVMRGVDIKDMLALKVDFEEKIIVTFNSANKNMVAEITDDGKCFGEVLPKGYCSNFIIQEDMEMITLRKIIIDSSKDIEFKIISEQGEYSFNTYCDGINQFQTIIPCKKFKIEVNSTADMPYVNLVKIEYVKRS